MPYEILIHELAIQELETLRAFDQRRIVDEITVQLTEQPTTATRRRKLLIDLTPSFEHALPIWELRIGVFWVFYDVAEDAQRVHIRAIRRKDARQRGHSMKKVRAKDLQMNVDEILNSSQNERIVISRGGKPCAVLVGIEDYDAEDLRTASSKESWRMIHHRRTRGKSVPLAEVQARLKKLPGRAANNRTAAKKGRNQS